MIKLYTTQLYSLMFYEKIISDFPLNFENNFTLSHNTNSPKITTNDNNIIVLQYYVLQEKIVVVHNFVNIFRVCCVILVIKQTIYTSTFYFFVVDVFIR